MEKQNNSKTNTKEKQNKTKVKKATDRLEGFFFFFFTNFWDFESTTSPMHPQIVVLIVSFNVTLTTSEM